jgi:hypothetical protein
VRSDSCLLLCLKRCRDVLALVFSCSVVLLQVEDQLSFFFEVLRLVSTEEAGVLAVLHFGYIIFNVGLIFLLE